MKSVHDYGYSVGTSGTATKEMDALRSHTRLAVSTLGKLRTEIEKFGREGFELPNFESTISGSKNTTGSSYTEQPSVGEWNRLPSAPHSSFESSSAPEFQSEWNCASQVTNKLISNNPESLPDLMSLSIAELEALGSRMGSNLDLTSDPLTSAYTNLLESRNKTSEYINNIF